jgi:hypothetical protein
MSHQTAVLATGAALVAASLGLGYMAYTSSSSSSTTPPHDTLTVTEIDEDNDNDNSSAMITEQDVCQIFDKLFLEVQQAFAQLMNQIQQLQMTGQRIPDEQVQMIMRQELERALLVKQGAIVEMAGIDMECLEEAVWEFVNPENDAYSSKVRIAVERLQKLWQTATGQAVVGWRPGKTVTTTDEEPLDADTTIRMASVYFDALSDAMRQVIASYKASGQDLRSPAVQQALNMEFAGAANDAGEAALQAHGVSQSQFEASVKAHKNNAQVTQALTMMQIKQGQEFSAMQSGG